MLRSLTRHSASRELVRSALFCLAVLSIATCFPESAPSAEAAEAMPLPQGSARVQTAERIGLPELRIIRELPRSGSTFAVAWSSDGREIAAFSLQGGNPFPGAGGDVLTIWNADGQVVRELRQSHMFFTTSDNFVFIDNNKKIVAPPSYASHDLAFSIFDIETGKIVHEAEGLHPDRPRNSNAASVLAVSPDQSTLAVIVGPSPSQPVALYSTQDWARLALPETLTIGPSKLAFSRDGKFLAVSRSDNKILIYDLSSKQVSQRIDPFSDLFSPNGGIAFSPDGSMIAVGTAALVTAKSLPNGKTTYTYPKDVVRVFRTKDASQVAVYSAPTFAVRDLAWSPDASFVAFITGDRKLLLWDPLHPELGERTFDVSPGTVSLAFSPDGSRLAVGNGRNVTIFGVAQQ